MNKLLQKFITLGKRAYFAVWYNTTSAANICLTLGVVVPYILWQALTGHLTRMDWLDAADLPLIAAYWYGLIYVVNDAMDYTKDRLKKIPKHTSRQIFGNKYIGILAACYLVTLVTIDRFVPALFAPLAVYAIALMLISVVHSRAGQWKYITIFLERAAKFCAPMALLAIASGEPVARTMLIAAALVFPFGYTFDYAYAGYFRDRLKQNPDRRYAVYAAYWLSLGFVILAGGWVSMNDLAIIGFYIGTFAIVADVVTYLATRLPFGVLDRAYTPVEAWEKRRLVTYGLVNLGLIALGGLYAFLR